MTNGERVYKKLLIKLYDKLLKNKFRKNTVEMLNVHLTFNPNEEYLDYPYRMANREYIKNELQWFISQDLNIKNHIGIENNKIWKNCATKHGKVNSNYGYLVFHKNKIHKSQIEYALNKLIEDKYSRQSIIIYTRPSLQWEYNDNKHANYDFTCTTHTQHFINEKNQFDYIVNMRSNDAIFGLQNDYSWHRYIYFLMYNTLKNKYKDLKIGHIYWNAGSMHIYDRHFELLLKMFKSNKGDKGE